MEKLTLAQADTIIDKTFAKGGEMGLKPLTVAVLDDGGNLVAFKKQDNSSVMRFEIARGKAWGAIGMGTASRNLENVAKEPEVVFLADILNQAGAKIEGQGTDMIIIQGVSSLKPIECRIFPDRIEAGTYMIAAAITLRDLANQSGGQGIRHFAEPESGINLLETDIMG